MLNFLSCIIYQSIFILFSETKDCEALRYKDQEDKAQDDHYNCAKGRGKT
ncbi:unnamed protein product [Moneuplotes crassus]|uniref:Uncharacterized protein n=1 Tax=Euplotes crassus TaxID=5936 RepID=A0AAD2DD03_EUPCR|nr:unnamed protein product [Moneuplotes crassus]